MHGVNRGPRAKGATPKMTMSWRTAGAAAAMAMVFAGCGQKSGEANSQTQSTPAPAPQPAVPAGPTATLTGTIHFQGTPPERRALKMSADDACSRQHADQILSEDVIVGAGGGLKNVFVSIVGGLEGRTFAPPATPVVLDQKGCVYSPHVFGVMAKQTLQLLNSDPTLHNVHAIPEQGPGEFNIGMPRQGMEIPKSFDNPGVVRFKCDVHPWMLSWGVVTTHPHFGVSDDSGRYTIAGLPPGQYAVQAWHEKLGTQSGTLTVGADAANATLDFTFSGGS
jgi:plastocyanin